MPQPPFRCHGTAQRVLKKPSTYVFRFMERWSWVLFCVQENRAWTEELLAMARELFEAQAKADKPSLRYHRPSFAHESAQDTARRNTTPSARPPRRR